MRTVAIIIAAVILLLFISYVMVMLIYLIYCIAKSAYIGMRGRNGSGR